MNDSLAKLLECLESKIQDIHENRIELKSLSEVYETIKEIVDLGENSYLDILDYYDQEFIIKAIKISGHDAKKYVNNYIKTRYLLKNQNEYLKDLPQYKEAIIFMEKLFKYLYGLYQNIKLEYETKEQNLKIQELFNKYYILLRKNNIFIEDIQEFLTFLDLSNIENKDKLNILILITKNNTRNYITTNDITIEDNIKLSNIENLLVKYSDLYISNYNQKENLEFNQNGLLKISNKEELLNKKYYLYNKIKKLYKNKKYEEIIKYYLNFNTILNYENEFIKQEKRYNKDLFKKLVFVNNNNKSLIREYLDETKIEYKSAIYKNLLDIESQTNLVIPDYYYEDMYFYIKDEFIIKTIYMYLENGYILILDVLDKDIKIEDFLKRKEFKDLKEIIEKQNFDLDERDLMLKNIKLEDLVLTIDLNTLDIKNGGKDARKIS